MTSAGKRFIWLLAPAVVAALGCATARVGGAEEPAPGVTFPARFAEGDRAAEPPPPTAGSASAAPAEGGPPRTGYLPDPRPLRLARQWEYELRHERGSVRVERVTKRTFAQPVVTARRMGRYAIELWIGRELVDRVRFDFPLLGAEPVREGSRRPLDEPPSFAPGAEVTRTVLVPASERATRAVLLDRATGQEQPLPWPPDAPLPLPSSPAPAPVRAPLDAEDADAGPAEPASPDAG